MKNSIPINKSAGASALLTLGICAALSPASAAQLVVNGSFEQPAIPYNTWIYSNSVPGWTLGSGSKGNAIEIQDNAAGSPMTGYGNQFVELDSNGTTVIYQDIPTTPGTQYQLQFVFSPRPGVPDNQLQINWGGATVDNLSVSGSGLFNTAWQTHTYTVTATSTTTRLSFNNLNELSNTYGAYLDGVSVTPLASPAQLPAKLAILLPDVNPATATPDPLNLPQAQAWLDAVGEEGYNVDVIRDSQFAAVAGNYSGIILPDSVHTEASSTLLNQITNYVNNQGGTVMIVYDFGSLGTNGLFPVSGPNPFSSLVGLDYNNYGELYGQSTISPVGLGPIYGMESTLWNLQVPPGKYMSWPNGATPAATTAAAATIATATAASSIPTAYLPNDSTNPGGMNGYDAGYIHRIPFGHENGVTLQQIIAAQAEKIPQHAMIGSWPNRHIQNPTPYTPTDALQGVSGYLYGFLNYPTYVTCNLGHTSSAGNLSNFSSNCTGTGQAYTGTPLLVSDRFGVVAGYATQGKGNVLFVNLPLSYLKVQTDAMLMDGFIRYLGDQVLQIPRLSPVPNGIPGMTVNVHVDSQAAIAPIQQMQAAGIWNSGPFSVHFTGGPLVDYLECQMDASGAPVRSLAVNGKPATCANMVPNPLGDVVYQLDANGNKINNPNAAVGLDINRNFNSQQLVKFFDGKGHQVGPHGGWLHDYYGYNAHDDVYDTTTSPPTLVNPSNQSSFQNYLVLNKSAVEAAANHSTTEYSAPVGNNPKWAVTWLENNGILGMYYLGDTGMGATRHWREGQLLNQNVWMLPVMPFGLYATFEEFTEYGVSATDVTAWLNKLVDFDVTNGVNRMIYFHPPGAIDYLPSLTSMISRGNSYANSAGYSFQWNTISDIGYFMGNRRQVTWTATPQANGSVQFQASHPSTLQGQTWVLPKARYNKPVLAQTWWWIPATATVSQNANNWLVTATSGTSLSFSATTTH